MSDKHLKLTAELREKAGKGTARAIRREEKLPAVIYGGKESPVTISLSAHDFAIEYMKGKIFTTIVDLNVGGKDHLVLARDVQLHPVTDNVLHVDFLRVTEKTTLTVSVPIRFIDEDKCPGLETKGILNTVRHEVDIICKATNMPDEIQVSLEGKDHGDSINMSDAIMPEGSRSAIDDRDITIAVLNAPKRVVVETEEAEGETASSEGGEEASSEGGEE
jgi:large subunit ribosomal protein L25